MNDESYEIDEQGRTVVSLGFPAASKGQQITELHVRRIKGRDMRRWEKSGVTGQAATLAMIVDLAEVPPEVVDDMDLSDIARASEVIEGFLAGQGGRTGAN